MTILIGIAGKARTGKDTAASYIERMYGFERYAFAQPIKDALHSMGFYRELYDSDEQKERIIPGLDVSYRKLTQTLGTEWARHTIHPDFWLKLAQRAFYRAKDYDAAGFVISDVRFENEACWIRSEGGAVVHLEGVARVTLAGDGHGHSSESGVSRQLGDVVVANTGDFTFMFDQLDTVLETLNKEHGR